MDDFTHDLLTRQREARLARTAARTAMAADHVTIRPASWRARTADALRRVAGAVDGGRAAF